MTIIGRYLSNADFLLISAVGHFAAGQTLSGEHAIYARASALKEYAKTTSG